MKEDPKIRLSKLTRREFVKGSGAVLLLSFLGGCTPGTITSTITTTQTNTKTVTNEPSVPVSRTIVDMEGHTLTVPSDLTRLAVPGGTEYTIMMVLGRDQNIVAANTGIVTTNAWMHLVSPTSADAVVAFGPTNIEAIAESNPQLIVTYNGDSYLQQYDNAGLIYYMVGTNSTRQNVKAEVSALASLLGETERGNAYINYFDEKTLYLQNGMKDLSDTDRPTVLNVYTYDNNQTFKTAGTGMAQTSDIYDGGGINVAAESVQGFVTITVEQIAQWDPECIIYNGTVAQMEVFKAAFPSLRAVASNNIHLEPGGVWGWSGISAENILQPLYLATILHPDLFPELDIREEVKYFYKNFYDFMLTDEQITAIMNKENPPG